MVKIKWSDANQKAIPDGTIVKAAVDKVEFIAASQQSGQPQFKVQITINEPDDYENRKLFQYFSLTSDSLWSLKKFVVAWGGDPDLFEDDDQDTDDIAAALRVLEGYLIVGEQEYPKGSGEMTNRVKRFITEEVALAQV